jgi:hypothetical protein
MYTCTFTSIIDHASSKTAITATAKLTDTDFKAGPDLLKGSDLPVVLKSIL